MLPIFSCFTLYNDMNIRKKIKLMPGIMAKQGVLILAIASVVGCTTTFTRDSIDYKSSAKAAPLDVPPDLTQLQRENRFAIPETNRGSATASGYTLQQQGLRGAALGEAGAASGGQQVSVSAAAEIRVERQGDLRWLVVQRKPEVLFPIVKEFWEQSGFAIVKEVPEAGIMETDFVENRAKIPQDFIRNTIGKVFDSLYSSGERDKFRTRLERTADGNTEIYISHRGVEEVFVGQFKESTVLTGRNADPVLEAEFLSRLMTRLGIDAAQAKNAVADAKQQPAHAKLLKNADASYVEVNEGFDRSWRRIGLALDRVGFTVEDRDRIQGLYFVRFMDQIVDAQGKSEAEKGFFKRLFSSDPSGKAKEEQRYRVAVKAGDGDTSQIFVFNNSGKPENSPVGEKILSLLNDQLK